MQEIQLCKRVLGYPITLRCTLLDEGIHVLITDGCRTHVGAVTTAWPVRTILRESHRDNVVSEQAARLLYVSMKCPVTVCAGIHYDDVSAEDIRAITDAAEGLVRQLIRKLQAEGDS